MELRNGTNLQNGKYKIERSLGRGSFGITYLAVTRFTTTGALGEMEVEARVAVKEFFMGEVNSRGRDGTTVEGSSGSICTDYRRKFRREAENLAKLSHPDIVRVFDVFDENNTSYYVMEFLDGGNLDEYILARGRIAESEALGIIRAVGGAVAYMHDHRMLHLDVKPKNVMHRADGRDCLIDFGLSKQCNAAGEPESSTSLGLGTPGYAPLEQVHYRRDGTFPATLDVYALGATLFKMLTGQRPPEAAALLDDGFPAATLSACGVGTRTIDAVAKAMAPGRKQRYATVREFLAALPKGKTESGRPGDESNGEEMKVDHVGPVYAPPPEYMGDDSEDDFGSGGVNETQKTGFSMWRDRNWFTNIYILGCFITTAMSLSSLGRDIRKYEFSVVAYLVVSAYILLCLNGTLRILSNQKKGWYLPFLFMPVVEILCNILDDGFAFCSISVCFEYAFMLLTLLIRKKGVSAFKRLGTSAAGCEKIKDFVALRDRNGFVNFFLYLVAAAAFVSMFLLSIHLIDHSDIQYGVLLGTLIGIAYSHYLLIKNYKMGLVVTPLCIISGLVFEAYSRNAIIYGGMAALYLCQFLTFLIRENGRSALSLLK